MEGLKKCKFVEKEITPTNSILFKVGFCGYILLINHSELVNFKQVFFNRTSLNKNNVSSFEQMNLLPPKQIKVFTNTQLK